MDLANVFKYDIDTLKSFNNEINEENVEFPTYCTSPYRPKLIEWQNGNNQDENVESPTYCTSPHRPNLIEWQNGNNQDIIQDAGLISVQKSPITSKPTYCTSPYKPNLIQWGNENSQDTIEEVGLISVQKSLISPTSNQPTYCISSYKPNLIQWENGNSQDTIEEIELVISPKSPITATSNHLTTIPQPSIITDKREEKKSDLSNKQLLVESVLFECFEDNTSTTSDNLPVFTIDAAYCNFDSSNILHGRLRWGR